MGTKVFNYIKKVFNYNLGCKEIYELSSWYRVHITGHDSLQYLGNEKFIKDSIMGVMLPQQYGFKDNVIQGAHNHAADYLNRVVYDV